MGTHPLCLSPAAPLCVQVSKSVCVCVCVCVCCACSVCALVLQIVHALNLHEHMRPTCFCYTLMADASQHRPSAGVAGMHGPAPGQGRRRPM